MYMCDRCLRKSDATIMSMFNAQLICMECKAREEKHPELEAVRRGETNFRGVGLPGDLAVEHPVLARDSGWTDKN